MEVAVLLPGKEPLQYPLKSKLGGEEKNILPLLASEPWLVQPVA
jgi:hypothetical protein